MINSMKKTVSRIINNIILPLLGFVLVYFIWDYFAGSDVMPSFMMPSPKKVWEAFLNDRELLFEHATVTLKEAFLGLFIGVLLGFVLAVLMDNFKVIYRILYPLVIVTQTIPTIAIAPLLILWFGYEMKPKIILIVLTTFFPLVINLLEGFKSVDSDYIKLLKSMGAGKLKIFWHIKLPSSLGSFFAGLKIAVAYAIVGGVISEWLGGQKGLGVLMTRMRKSFAYDRMFSIILFVSVISLILMALVVLIKWLVMPWERKKITNE